VVWAFLQSNILLLLYSTAEKQGIKMAAPKAGRKRTPPAKKTDAVKPARAARVTRPAPAKVDAAEVAQAVVQKNDNDLWWLILLQGIAAIAFGIIAVFWPGLTLVSLVYLFSAFILAWGIIEVIRGLLSMRRSDTWWLALLFGLVVLVVGVYLVRHPRVSFTALVLIIGLTLIGRGLLDLASGFLTRHDKTHRILTFIIGIAALIAGIIMLFEPEAGGIAFVWILGLYALIYGALTITLAIEARELIRNHRPDSDRGR
jgi:uncharacterized membrane protein HdeD (DUF308 family)